MHEHMKFSDPFDFELHTDLFWGLVQINIRLWVLCVNQGEHILLRAYL